MTDAPFHVFWGGNAIAALNEMTRNAADEDLRHKLKDVIKMVNDQLRNAPEQLGEIYRSRGAIAEHIAVRKFLAIDFAIDQQKRLVLVRSRSALSGHGL